MQGFIEYIVITILKTKTNISSKSDVCRWENCHVVLGYLPWSALLLGNYPVFLLTFIPVFNYSYTLYSLTWVISLPKVRPFVTVSCQPNLATLHPSILRCLHQLGCTDVEAHISRFKAWFFWLINVCRCKLHSSHPVVRLSPLLSCTVYDALCDLMLFQNFAGVFLLWEYYLNSIIYSSLILMLLLTCGADR